MNRKHFKIKISYFKPSGKFYISDYYCKEYLTCENGTCYMYEVVDDLKQMKESNLNLPGLLGNWDGPILVECEEGFPHLII